MPLDESTQRWLALWLVSGLGPRRIARLLEAFGTIEGILSAPQVELERVSGIGRTQSTAILESTRSEKFHSELKRIEAMNLRILTLEDQGFPTSLKKIYAPPPLLFVKGELDFNQGLYIAFVGSRKASYNGKSFCKKLILDLAKLDPEIVVVSGMALGIDTEAHKAALEAGLKTVAVLAGGLSHLYPHQNRSLAESIAGNGALVTEFSTTTKPQAGYFPLRNRILSGLCKGVMVVEASENSGALITARYAADQKRKVFAMPGTPESPCYMGTNRLMQKGAAKMVLNAEDLYSELAPGSGPRPRGTRNEQLEFGKLELTPDEEAIMEILEKESLSQDILAQRLGMPIHKLLALLTPLQMKGLIVHKPGSIYQAVGL